MLRRGKSIQDQILYTTDKLLLQLVVTKLEFRFSYKIFLFCFLSSAFLPFPNILKLLLEISTVNVSSSLTDVYESLGYDILVEEIYLYLLKL